MEPGAQPEESNTSIDIAIQEVIASEVKQQVKNEMMAILDSVEVAIHPLFPTTTLGQQMGSVQWCAL